MAISITPQEKEILRSVTIPPRPEALLTFSSEAKKDEPNIGIIAEAINSDISISSALLQVVNSAAFRRVKEIESIDQAVMILGLKRIIPLVKAVALKSSIKASQQLTDFWQSQSDIAAACSVIAPMINKPALADHSYMLGLFHCAGVPILMQHFDDYNSVLESAQANGWSEITELEFSQYNTSHTTIGASLAQKWKLPPAMIQVIYYLHEVEDLFASGELNDVAIDLMSILKLARYCVDFKRDQNSENLEWFKIRDQIEDKLNLSDLEISELRDKVIDQLE